MELTKLNQDSIAIDVEPTSTEFIKSPKQRFENLYDYLLLLWDGLGFFGFDETKLGRLEGKPVTFLTKFKSKRWVIISLISIVVVLVVVSSEI